MSKNLMVQAIFRSLDGEANGYAGAGQPSVFIRLRGCNLRCAYCDTKYAQASMNDTARQVVNVVERDALGQMSPKEIVHEVLKFPGYRKVTLTGGDPLVQLPNVMELISQLIHAHCDVTIETNGSMSIQQCCLSDLPRVRVPAGTCEYGHGSVRFVVDYKLPSSGMEDRMESWNWGVLTWYDVMKFVISDEKDYHRALQVIGDHAYCKAQMVFSPAIDPKAENPMEWPEKLATMLLEQLQLPVPINYSLQIHKVLWPGATNER